MSRQYRHSALCASGVAAIALGAMGPNFGVASACAAGSHAIGEALRANGPMRDIKLWPWWRRIECPVLALRGAESKILPAETAAEMRQDGAEVIEYPGIGHTPSLMVAEQIEAVTAWLRG